MKEQELVQSVLKGDRSAQKILFETYAPEMMTLCNRYSPSKELASDMMQEGFISVFQKLHQYKGSGSLKGWIRTVMVNSALSILRKEKKFKFASDIEEVHVENTNTDVLSQMAFQEITELIQKMPDGYRTVFNLFAIEGYSHKEIAKQLEITESTSKTQYRKSKIYLQKLIAENE